MNYVVHSYLIIMTKYNIDNITMCVDHIIATLRYN